MISPLLLLACLLLLAQQAGVTRLTVARQAAELDELRARVSLLESGLDETLVLVETDATP